MIIKNLSDFERYFVTAEWVGRTPISHEECVFLNKLKTKAIKWIKEDIEALNRLHPEDIATWMISINRWMKRLNLTREDLK